MNIKTKDCVRSWPLVIIIIIIGLLLPVACGGDVVDKLLLVVTGTTDFQSHLRVTIPEGPEGRWFDNKLCSTLSLFAQVHHGYRATYCWGDLCDGLTSHPGGSGNTPSCFMLPTD